MDYVEYTTKDGERWDTIAFNAYGDVSKTEQLVAANPNVLVNSTLPGGIIIYLPVLTKDDSTDIQTELLPPWKQ